MSRVVCVIMLFMLLIGMSTFEFDMRTTCANPERGRQIITVPSDYPTIQEAIDNAYEGDTIFVRNGTYYENVVVNKTVSLIGQDRETTVIDGGGIGKSSIVQVNANDVTISGFTIRNATGWPEPEPHIGISAGTYTRIVGNTVTNNTEGIVGGYGCIISGNFITYNGWRSIMLGTRNTLSDNVIRNNLDGVCLIMYAENNTITCNIIVNNDAGIIYDVFYNVFSNTITNNTIAKNNYGIIFIDFGSKLCNDTIYHNDFINNTKQASSEYFRGEVAWDNGYPSGGNYWSDYQGIDFYSGPYQNETGSDGIGDTPYIIDNSNNQDRYPLMKTYNLHNIGITNVTFKRIVGQGFSLSINVEIVNYGNCLETFNVTLYANTSMIEKKTITLTSRSSLTVTFTWDTTGFAKRNYTISANAIILPGETNTIDNTFIDGFILVTIAGDVTGEGLCDMQDISILVDKFLKTPKDREWDPNCDINDDLSIDVADISIAINHFLEGS